MAFVGIVLAGSASEILLLTALALLAIGLAADGSRNRALVLFYDFEAGDAASAYQRVLDVFRETMTCSRKELVREGPLEGDFQSIRATSVTADLSSTAPGIETNVTMAVLQSAWRSIYLLPDCILTVDDRQQSVSLVPYRELIIESGQSPVIETSPPDDATVLSSSDEGSDVGVTVYDWIRLATPGHDIALIQLSKAGSAIAFAEALEGAGAKLVRA